MMPEEEDERTVQRRRLARALMLDGDSATPVKQMQGVASRLFQQGTSAEPVGHWTQAAARVAQSLVGAANMNSANEMAGRLEQEEAAASARKQADSRAYSEGATQREVQQKMQLAQQAGLQPGSPEFKQYVYGIKPPGSDAANETALIQNYKFRMALPEDQREAFDRVQRAENFRDVGTGYIDPVTNRFIPKNIVDAEAQQKLGEALGTQAAAAGGDMDAADTALELVDSIRNDPNRSAGTSTLSPIGNLIPKTPGFAYQTKVDQAKSGAFMTAIQQMRGMGALSNAEGQTATAAVTRMTTATSDKDFEEALTDYERLVERGRRKAAKMNKERQRLLGTPQSPMAAPAPASSASGSDDWEEVEPGVKMRVKR